MIGVHAHAGETPATSAGVTVGVGAADEPVVDAEVTVVPRNGCAGDRIRVQATRGSGRPR